jgi:phenylacetate-CoA ligase
MRAPDEAAVRGAGLASLRKSEAAHADLLNPEYRAWLRFLEESETWSSEEIERYQFERVKKTVQHAYENTKGYRRLFDDGGVAPHMLKAMDDIRRLPFTTKEDLRDRLEDFSAVWPGRKYVTTGGSTGIPFGFYRDEVAFSRELASKAHQYHRVGWKEGDRQLVLRGLPIQNSEYVEYAEKFEELRCSSYHLTPAHMEIFYRRALDYGPQWLRCYPSSGFLFARFLDERGLRIPSIRGVLCASENLYDFQRALMQRVFGQNVYSHYGHYELAVLAGFCEHAPWYHVLPQYGYAELVDRNGAPVTQPGALGEIVGTSFLMFSTPFIRYRTQDFAVLKSFGCSLCGRPYQIWERVEGRLQEFIVTGAGRLISMTAINMHDKTFDPVSQFQFHQSERGRLTLRYIPKAACDPSSLYAMKHKIAEKLGSDVDLALQPVNEIALTARGKHRFLIQELTLEHGDA